MSNQSQISSDINHAYFTSAEDAAFAVSVLREHGWLERRSSVLEPSAGAGALSSALEDSGVAVKIADLVDYGIGATIQDYLVSDFGKFDLVFTNPPFGKMATLAVSFFNKATTNSDRIAFIVPQSFRKISIIDRLDTSYWPVADEDLPSQLYDLPDGTVRKVRTCLQLWERRDTERPKLGNIDYSGFFTPLTKDVALSTEGAFAVRGQGSAAGRILEGLDHSPASTRFLLGSREEISSMDLTTIAGFTAGIPSIGFAEIAHALSVTDRVRETYLKRGALSLLMGSV